MTVWPGRLASLMRLFRLHQCHGGMEGLGSSSSSVPKTPKTSVKEPKTRRTQGAAEQERASNNERLPCARPDAVRLPLDTSPRATRRRTLLTVLSPTRTAHASRATASGGRDR